jgi:hypothetical protein
MLETPENTLENKTLEQTTTDHYRKNRKQKHKHKQKPGTYFGKEFGRL